MNLVGKTTLHDEILEKLGGGDTGIVYKAEDTKFTTTVDEGCRW